MSKRFFQLSLSGSGMHRQHGQIDVLQDKLNTVFFVIFKCSVRTVKRQPTPNSLLQTIIDHMGRLAPPERRFQNFVVHFPGTAKLVAKRVHKQCFNVYYVFPFFRGGDMPRKTTITGPNHV